MDPCSGPLYSLLTLVINDAIDPSDRMGIAVEAVPNGCFADLAYRGSRVFSFEMLQWVRTYPSAWFGYLCGRYSGEGRGIMKVVGALETT